LARQFHLANNGRPKLAGSAKTGKLRGVQRKAKLTIKAAFESDYDAEASGQSGRFG
jgi:hypothetical protein